MTTLTKDFLDNEVINTEDFRNLKKKQYSDKICQGTKFIEEIKKIFQNYSVQFDEIAEFKEEAPPIEGLTKTHKFQIGLGEYSTCFFPYIIITDIKKDKIILDIFLDNRLRININKIIDNPTQPIYLDENDNLIEKDNSSIRGYNKTHFKSVEENFIKTLTEHIQYNEKYLGLKPKSKTE